MKTDAVYTSPPFGISMLSVQMMPPASGTTNLRLGVVGLQLGDVARPAEARPDVAARQHAGVVVAP
jgi:hypothetical protein